MTVFVIISLLSIVILISAHFLKKDEKISEILNICDNGYHMEDIVDVVAILSGISGVLVGFASIRISNLGAVKEYFQQGDDKDQIEARKNLYKKFDEGIKIEPDDKDASLVISFFHFWGLMVKKKYLPFLVFKSASGHAVIILYEGLQPMIQERRRKSPDYAEYFEWLYLKCKKKRGVFQGAALIPVQESKTGSSFLSDAELQKIGFLSYGKNVSISRKASIYNPGQMVLGDNVRIDDFCILSGKITIGSYIHISAHSCLIAGGYGIELKNFVTISSRCAVYAMSDDYSGESLNYPSFTEQYRTVVGEKVVLSQYVTVGTGSTILPGVVLEEGTAVGAMSLVKSSLEGWKIYVGIPCKAIGERSKKMKELAEKVESFET